MRFFVPLVVCLLLAFSASADQVFLKGNFVETRKELANAKLTGEFYYFYDTSNKTKSRIRFKYYVKSAGKYVSNLYHYEYKAQYSMCGKCTAETISELPDPWWVDTTTTNIYQADTNGWYKHKNPDKTTQVSRIKMLSGSTTIPQYIEFFDGRNVTFSSVTRNPSDLKASSAVFQMDSGASCPTPTCSMLADIVFVMDYSGSVDRNEWSQMANFVIEVMKQFTFGDTAAAAACVQFCAPYCQDRPNNQVWTSIPGCYWSHVMDDIDFDKCGKDTNSLTPEMTAKVLAGQQLTGGNWTVSTNRDSLVNTMSQSRSPYGRTCQAYGLELAAKIFENSPRNRYGVPPNRIVIGMTDGDDYCPNRTKRAAANLIANYSALYIGVGIALDCDYDKDYLKRIVSKIGTEPAYYDVTNFNAIKQLTDQLFTPLCDQFHQSECGAECKGFCGCGECFCPDCNSDNNKCHDLQCVARDGTASGCVDTVNKSACAASDKCTQYQCQYEYSTGKQWCTKTETCSAKAQKNPGKCRSVTCDKTSGACKVNRDHNVCKNMHTNNKCEEWTCAEEDKSAKDYTADQAYNEVSGCYRSKYVHKTCEEMSKGKCVEYKCSMDTGTCKETDLCKSDQCTTRTCPKDSNNVYGSTCTETKIAQPKPDTKCTFYKCDPVNGWGEDESRKVTGDTCREADPDPCKEFFCDDAKGCDYTTVNPDKCAKCTEEFRAGCVKKAQQMSSSTQCRAGLCKLDNTAEPYCNVDDPNDHENITDCTKSVEASTARELNQKNPTSCFTVECNSGACKVVPVPRNNNLDTNCTKFVCDEYTTGQWRWKAEDTDIKKSCVTDDCTERVCVDDKGCVETDVCYVRTTECVSYTCEIGAGGKAVCEGHNELKEYTCMHEICDETGTKKLKIASYETEEELRALCHNEDLCTEVTCDELGECAYRNKKEVEEEKDGDPCKIWSCDDSTGDVSWKFKCDDGLYCTEDKCSFDGSTCRNSPINCYLEVNMTDYPCFRAECVESPETESYRCVRKLKSGVYIDICGNCLRDYIPTSSESEESLPEADETCIEAPEEPMLKEGLAAASIALIVLGAIIIGGAMAASGVIGTKTLLERARAANNQSAHSNPLFEDNEAEMTNPTFTGEQ